MLWKNAIVPSALEFVRRPDTEKPFTLARKTVINSTQISHIIRHNNMAIFAPLTLFG